VKQEEKVPKWHIKLQCFKELAGDRLSGARTGLGTGSAFGAEIPVECVDGRVQNQVAVGAGFQMALNLAFNGLREATL
jgi:hypothetical protein